MKKGIILACTFMACGQVFGSNFGEQAEKLRTKEEQAAMERQQKRAEMKENIQEGFNELGKDAKAVYRAAEYKLGIRVINTASSWMIEVKDPISFGKWILLPKANNPLNDENVCYITALKDFKVRVVDQNTQQPMPGSEMTIKRGSNEDIFAINVRSISAGHKKPTVSYEAYSADDAQALPKFSNIDL
jgi:hypothetical protein